MKKLMAVGCLIASVVAAPGFAFGGGDAKSEAGKFSFALIGDTPYDIPIGQEAAAFNRLQAELNGDVSLNWIMHVGDIKRGASSCSDEMYSDRLARYSKFLHPLVYTPGDNDWTDCYLKSAGEYRPMERLEKLRSMFFPQPGVTLGKRTMKVTSQASSQGFEEFRENVMWEERGVVFSAIHMVGGANGLKPPVEESSVARTKEYYKNVKRRTQGAIAWLDQTFVQAKKVDAPGVFVMIHANPILAHKKILNALRDESGVVRRKGYSKFLQALEKNIAAYGKPVVLAHGDSHYYRVDKPHLPSAKKAGKDRFHANFTRVETFGARKVHWIKVHVDPASNEVFQFEQKLVSGNGFK